LFPRGFVNHAVPFALDVNTFAIYQVGLDDVKVVEGQKAVVVLLTRDFLAQYGLAQSGFAQDGIEPPPQLFEPVGCPACRGKGFRGRIGVFEVVLADPDLVQLITQGATEQEVRDQIRRTGTPDLTLDALSKVTSGLTSLDEARKMTWA